jgi:hypothetical protein
MVSEDASRFQELFERAVERIESEIHVVITMHGDFCSRFLNASNELWISLDHAARRGKRRRTAELG